MTTGRAGALAAGAAYALLVLCLLAGCQAAGQTRQSVDVLATQTARCPDPGPQREGPGGIAFAEPSAWQAHLAGLGSELRERLWSWRVDFRHSQSVALVDAGPLPNPGYRVSVGERSLPVREQTLQVPMNIEPPPPGSIQAQVISFPCVYLKVQGAPFREVAVQALRLGSR